MKEFIEYLIKQIVTNPNSVIVEESQAEGIYIYTITVSKEDMGTVIGKQGRNINSIRNMARVKAIKDNIRIKINVADQDRDQIDGQALNQTETAEQADA